ncbi:MAG: Re/Si-specific NAD(P)(+) transhydrogenase subunit alpha [Natronomonas sp.]
MIIGVPSETAENETRAALVPPAAEKLIDQGFEVLVSAGIGEDSGWSDESYRDVGCEVIVDRASIFERSDVIFHVQGLGATDDPDLDAYTEGQIVIGLLGPYDNTDELEELADRGVTAFALELIPRISRAQSMDALSSMASIGGYKATVMAANALPKMLPMQMTAAGTVKPAEMFVVGAGVAGLQAIATGERLGASVRAYDIRPEVKEEVESLGAEFVEFELDTEDDVSDEQGRAQEQDEEFYDKQRQMMTRVVAESDIVITTAAIPGRPSPELVTTEMIEGMDSGSVIVDLAAEGGGNCEPTQADEVVDHEGVTIFGPTNLPGTVTKHASQLYANNVTNFFQNLLEDDWITIDTSDEIVDSTMLTHEGVVRHPHEDDEDTDDEETDGGDTDDSTDDETGDNDD